MFEIWSVRRREHGTVRRSSTRIGYVILSINMLKLMSMVYTACVVIVIRKDSPRRGEKVVLIIGDNSSTIQ